MTARILVATLALAAAAPVAAAPTPAQLLQSYAPVLSLHADERFPPVAVDAFLAASALEQRTEDGSWQPVPAAALPAAGGPWRLNQRTCTPRIGVASIDCYAATRPGAATVYARYTRTRDRLALPHCSGKRRVWARVPKVAGTHPLVHVALGSHSNWFGPGDHPIDTRCYPQAARVVFDAYLPAVLDRTGSATRIRPRVVQVTERSPGWMRFPGPWGEEGWFHAPDPVNTVAYEAGPVGPAFHGLWREPVRTVSRWPAG